MKNMYHVFFALFAASASFGATVDLSTLTANYEAADGDVLTGELKKKVKISIANDAKVTLNDAIINSKGSSSSSYPWAGITCLGNCTIVLSGSNTVYGFYRDYPGIQAAKQVGDGEEYTLTIEGDGSLVASSSGKGSAGIGGGNGIACGNIVIKGGDITATGGSGAAGIGSGTGAGCGNITITNDVTKVVATRGGGDAQYSIGAGSNGGVGTVTIGGNEGAITDSPYEFVPAAPTTIDLATLTGDYEAKDGDVLTGELDVENHPVKITIANNAKVTLDNAKIDGTTCDDYDEEDPDCHAWAGLTCLGNCTIVLSGSNTVTGFYMDFPGIQVADGSTLTIEGDGSLNASSNGWGAGIGGGYSVDFSINCGNITIAGGTIIATGGEYAAGIGSGSDGTCGDITISGGNVTAKSGTSGAGIGCGSDAACGDITISGGKVTATGRASAGIGSGDGGSVGAITISGGEVTAMGGSDAAGIGGGENGACGAITITNDVTKVVATKGSGAIHSIGKGSGAFSSVGTVTIGGNVGAIEKSPYVFVPLVNVKTVGGKTVAAIDGNCDGDNVLNIAADVSVDEVNFARTFPVIEGTNNYSTIMFPFEIKAKEVGNIKQVVSFLGIGAKDNHKIVAVERVWCDDDSKDECNYGTAKFEAYKPYLIQLKSGETSVAINNTAPLVLKATPTELDAFDVAQSSDYNQYGDYVFRGVIEGKTWGASSDEVLGKNQAAAYGFAGTATSDISLGQFVKVGEGAFIKPFRAYIYKKPVPQSIKSNGAYALHQTASIDNDIPDVMDVVVVDRKKDGEEHTTVIGQFNSRTGEIRLNRTNRTYDLKGRHVRDASRMAKGVYFKK